MEHLVGLTRSDAGDHHDGSGLVSSSKDSATRTDEIFSMVEYDIMTIGNHELYRYETAKELYDHRDRWCVTFHPLSSFSLICLSPV